jgi:ATP-binding cassette subfamily A (ABC1) protein 3
VWLLTFVPFLVVLDSYDSLTFTYKLFMSLALNSCLGNGMRILAMLEAQGIGLTCFASSHIFCAGDGLQWWTLTRATTPTDPMCTLVVMAMMLVNSCVYMIIVWYVSSVWPGGDAVAEHPLFFARVDYWTRLFTGAAKRHMSLTEDDDEVDERDAAFEMTDTSHAQPYVRVHRLTKEFGPLLAVDRVSFEMMPNQVFALLGHNGAGKSTTVHMLTGMLAPTSGTAVIGGADLRRQLPDVRRVLGVCPQYNVLFDRLTVAEHMYFFCRLKDAVYSQHESDTLLESMDIDKKATSRAGTLSGGMKRKLSVAIALVGNSQLVVLDEPTSGIDANARHDIWRLLQRERRTRTILLTTHYMEEADVLADRIAIMAGGRVQCSGSPLFLKQRFGAGYHLTLTFDSTAAREREASTAVLNAVRAHSQQAQIVSTTGAEATYLLPIIDRPVFAAILADLEARQRKMAILSFGVSITTMEEVFLKYASLAISAICMFVQSR